MPVLWKALLGMLLTFPAGAYVAGTIVGPYDTATPPHQASPAAPGSPTPRAPGDPGVGSAYVGPTEAPAGPADTGSTSGIGGKPRSTAAHDGGPFTPGGRGFGREGPDRMSVSGSESPSETTTPSESSSETPTPSESGPTDGTTSGAPSEAPSQSSGGSTESPWSPDPTASTDATAG
ncbi:MAG TPA: hypothetical protein VF165_01795 [Nocardioidaceae bacterium]